MNNLRWLAAYLLLAAILAAVVVQGNRILRAMPYTQPLPATQDVRVVNSDSERVPVEMPTPETIEQSLRGAEEAQRIESAAKAWHRARLPAATSAGSGVNPISPEAQQAAEDMFPPGSSG